MIIYSDKIPFCARFTSCRPLSKKKGRARHAAGNTWILRQTLRVKNRVTHVVIKKKVGERCFSACGVCRNVNTQYR